MITAIGLHLLGEVAITVDDEPIELGTPKERHLFAVLALHAGTLVSRDRVVEALWPDRPPAKPASSLRAYVSHLRDALAAAGLERDVLETEAEGYALRIDRELLDIERFEALVAQAHDSSEAPATRAAWLDDALALVRGEPFADMPYAEFAQAEIQRLGELVATAHELRAELAVDLGDAARWTAELTGLVERYPHRDRLCAALMRALAQTGRRAEALRAFSVHRERLVDEMGLDPGPELRSLEIDILSMDDEAPAPSPAAATPAAAAEPEPAAERRLVTALAVAGDRPVPADWEALVTAHGGSLDPWAEGRLAWFGHPIAREGDAERAVRVALEAADDGSPVGVATGWRVAGPDTDSEPAAEPVEDAAYAAAARATSGQVIVDEATERLAVRWIRFEPEADGHARALSVRSSDGPTTPTIGREEELWLLRRRLDRAIEGEGQVVVLTGDAGVGKSRLIDALLADLADVDVVRFGCQPFHGGRAFHPVADAVARRKAQLVTDGVSAPLSSARRLLEAWSTDGDTALASVSADPEERRQALLRSVVTHVIGDDGPVVCVVEDLHWADPSTDELVTALADATGAHPLALIVSRRSGAEVPIAGRSNATSLQLGGLARADVASIVRAHAATELADDVVEAITARAEGIPLFAEVLARSAADGAELSAETVPTSIHDSLLARLDRLPESKAAAHAASVLGSEIDVPTLAAVIGQAEAAVEPALEQLCAEGFLVRHGAALSPHYRFRHALVLDAVHQTIPADRRAGLHARAARALLEAGADPARIARHWGEAGETFFAAQAWLDAAMEALAISALAEAIDNAERGLAVCVGELGDDVAGVVVDLHLAIGAAATQRFGPASPEAEGAFSAVLDDPALEPSTTQRFQAQWGRWFVASTRGDSVLMLRLAVELLATSLGVDDDEIRIEAHHAMWSTLILIGRYEEALQHTLKAKALYSEGRHHHLTYRYGGHDPGVCMWSIGGLARWMLGDAAQGVADGDAGLELADRLDHAYSQVEASFGPLTIAALDGDTERTRTITAELDALVDAGLVPPTTSGYIDGYRGAAALASGDATEAASLLVPAVDSWRSLWGAYCAPLEGYLAESLASTGDPDQAIAHIDSLFALPGRAEWWDAEFHRQRAAALVARGDLEAAVAEYEAAAAVAVDQAATALEARARAGLAALEA